MKCDAGNRLSSRLCGDDGNKDAKPFCAQVTIKTQCRSGDRRSELESRHGYGTLPPRQFQGPAGATQLVHLWDRASESNMGMRSPSSGLLAPQLFAAIEIERPLKRTVPGCSERGSFTPGRREAGKASTNTERFPLILSTLTGA